MLVPLHIKRRDAVETERLSQRRLNWIVEIILSRHYIDLIDRFAAIKVHFNPIGERTEAAVHPNQAVCAFTLTIVVE